MKGSEVCGWCGRDPAEGYATIWTEASESRYCHLGPSPTCYEKAQEEVPEDCLARLLALIPD